jgi:hypothetical protein
MITLAEAIENMRPIVENPHPRPYVTIPYEDLVALWMYADARHPRGETRFISTDSPLPSTSSTKERENER